jgi:hypothetical protein
MSDAVAANVVDPDGRVVELTEERWAHIVDGHPELTRSRVEILETVRAPGVRVAGRTAGESWFYKQDVGPSRWLKVVVRYESSERGWIVTAFARRRMP